MKIAHFNIEQLHLNLNNLGYAIFDLLDQKEIDKLLNYFDKVHNNIPNRFFASTHLEDKNLTREISDYICDIVTPKILGNIKNIQILGSAFIVKPVGKTGVLPLHQDWNLVDEKQARTYNLWIPLVDVSSNNGAMRVLPKSHNKEITYRGLNIPSRFRSIENYVDQHMITLDMKAGSGLLYDHALWHSSPQNHSKENRVCIVLGVSPLNVDHCIHQQEESSIATYDTDADYLLSNYGTADVSKLVKKPEKKTSIEAITINGFNELYLNKKKSLFKRILKSLRLSNAK